MERIPSPCRSDAGTDLAVAPATPGGRMCSITGQVTTRLALGVCFALFASGCGGGRSPVPTAPSNPVISGPPAPPAPPAPTVLTGPYSVTSVVADENGRPIEAVSVD